MRIAATIFCCILSEINSIFLMALWDIPSHFCFLKKKYLLSKAAYILFWFYCLSTTAVYITVNGIYKYLIYSTFVYVYRFPLPACCVALYLEYIFLFQRVDYHIILLYWLPGSFEDRWFLVHVSMWLASPLIYLYMLFTALTGSLLHSCVLFRYILYISLISVVN